MEAKRSAGRRRRRLLRACGTPERSAVVTLARREVGARSLVAVSRRRLPLSRVLRHGDGDGAAVLGFSLDGDYLLLVGWWEAGVDVHWRRADFPPPSDQDDDAQQPAVFSLRVGDWRRSDALPLGSPALSGCFVRVWQSVDCSLVVTIATDRHAASAGDASQLYQLSLAPAPAVDSGLAAAVTSLRFDFSVQAPAQSMEPWQLLDLARGLHVHHLLLNLGSAVSVLVFHVRQEEVADDDGRRRSLPFSVDSPRGLGISHFAQSEWYYSPEFPIEFHKERVERATMTARSGARLAVQVECLAQQMLDVEKFLQRFLDSFAPLRQSYLVDYDLRLVRVIASEKTLFMSCVMQLASLGGHGPPPPSSAMRPEQHAQRVALFFCVNLFTGAHHIIRALRVPLTSPLRHLSGRIARSFLADIDARVPPDARPASWDNAAVMREQSLRVLHNPRYPISIHLP